MRAPASQLAFFLVSALGSLGFSGCMTAYKKSVGANTMATFNRVYATDFNTAWQAVLDSMKSIRLDVTNREAGFLQSRWMDNTKEKNFTDGDGSTALYMRAQYRFKVNVAKGVYNKVPAIKITVQREQFAQRDALDDFRPLESDSIEENTLLYRIGRIIAVKTRLAKLEEYNTRMEIQRAAGASAASPEIPEGEAPPPPPAMDSGSAEMAAPEVPAAPTDEAPAPEGEAPLEDLGGDVPPPPESG